jgi:hypothetical protein
MNFKRKIRKYWTFIQFCGKNLIRYYLLPPIKKYLTLVKDFWANIKIYLILIEFVMKSNEKCQEEINIKSNFCKDIYKVDLDWKFIGLDNDGDAWFYDPTFLKDIFKDILKSLDLNYIFVQTKLLLTKKSKQRLIKGFGEIGEKYKNVECVKFLIVLDLSQKKFQFFDMTFNTSDGSQIAAFFFPLNLIEWSSICPSSINEILFTEVCQLRNERK